MCLQRLSSINLTNPINKSNSSEKCLKHGTSLGTWRCGCLCVFGQKSLHSSFLISWALALQQARTDSTPPSLHSSLKVRCKFSAFSWRYISMRQLFTSWAQRDTQPSDVCSDALLKEGRRKVSLWLSLLFQTAVKLSNWKIWEKTFYQMRCCGLESLPKLV